MRHDAHAAVHRTLMYGPGHCPPDLFAGTVPSIICGLKVHSATIWDARRSALADTFPRTRHLLGNRAFDSLADIHLGDERVLSRPLSAIGYGFPELLSGAARGLARLEWAWLESYGAHDAPAVMLDDLAGLTAPAAVAVKVALHPAARLVAGLIASPPVHFDEAAIRTSAVLITRPEEDVQLTEASSAVAELVHLLQVPRTLGDLLERDADGATLLLREGALTYAGGAEQ